MRPHCNTPLVKGPYDYPKCARCDFATNKNLPDDFKVKIVIYDNVKREIYRGAIDQ